MKSMTASHFTLSDTPSDDKWNTFLDTYKYTFHNGQPIRDGVHKINEGMISTSPFGTLFLIASLWENANSRNAPTSTYARQRKDGLLYRQLRQI